MPSNAAFHLTIETVGFQTAFSVNAIRSGYKEKVLEDLQDALDKFIR
jgi:hypothetical protein